MVSNLFIGYYKGVKMKKSTKIILLIVALLILVFRGGFYMIEQQRKEELKRNREYEVSLVNALKNS